MSQKEVKAQSEREWPDGQQPRPTGATYAKELGWVGEVIRFTARDIDQVNQKLREGWTVIGVFPYTDSQPPSRFEDYHYVLGRKRG